MINTLCALLLTTYYLDLIIIISNSQPMSTLQPKDNNTKWDNMFSCNIVRPEYHSVIQL